MGVGYSTQWRLGGRDPHARKKRGQGQVPLGRTQRRSVNPRSLSQVEGQPLPSDGLKPLGRFQDRTRSIQPSKTKLHQPFDPGFTNYADEVRGTEFSPNKVGPSGGPGATESN